jgi:hypothetical protein
MLLLFKWQEQQHKQEVLHVFKGVFVRYPACSAHAPYCHLWPPGSTVFYHIILSTARFSREKTLLNTECMMIH